MVVGYWAQRDSRLSGAARDSERIDELLPAATTGIRGAELKKYLEERGFIAFVFDGEVQDLRHHFEKGRPVVVCLGLKGRGGPLHYAVVVGIDDRSVWLNDSARGKLVRDDMERFRNAWAATGQWALLAVPSATP
jgi:hypothetical protein